MCYKGEKSNSFTRYYAPPEFLLDMKTIRDEKSDMWAFGVIILELFLKKQYYFRTDEQSNGNIEEQLNLIISKFGINGNISKEELYKIINDENSNKYSIEFNIDEIVKIDNDALDLIYHLLILNKNKRYSAEQVLKSKYLQEYFSCFNELDLPKIKNMKNILDYNNNYKKYFYESIIDEEIFIKIYKDLYSKLKII